MRFTTQEMVCFNSILDGEKIFGVTLEIPSVMIESTYIKETQDLLMNKGILDNEAQLTQAGAIPIRILDEYKKADRYIFLNHLRMSLHKDDSVIIISKIDDEYEFIRQHKTQFILSLFKQIEFLRNAGKPDDQLVEKVSMEDFEKFIDDYKAEEIFVVKKFIENEPVFEKVYCLKNADGTEYDISQSERKNINSWNLKRAIQELFEIEGEVQKNV